ncbi:DNA starvation/stationary phase protection protein [Danxiaibacter flavus]|uniref:DNA starvation/stationary phase protection protein n=1 Tax=Danxiaibacter flavus TaxID=3049108 RepID=A0ABV3ZCY8_9BACT|nr:DNA starvation/stationary phase protection protein [Chitinophagaceae bacterium DXS]
MKQTTDKKKAPKVDVKVQAAQGNGHAKHEAIKANLGLSEKNVREIVNRLSVLLADEHILYTKTRNYHWNVEGDNFMEMHKFYEGLYEKQADLIDEIAEKIRSLGHYAQGRLKDYLAICNLEEQEYTNDQRTQLKNLLDDHETIVRYLRKDVRDFDEKFEDTGTSDFVNRVLQDHEQWAWFIRSYLR